MIWLSLSQVADFADTSCRAIQQVISRSEDRNCVAWRGAKLIIRRVKGRGGKSGVSYEVAAESLPIGLQLAFNRSQETFRATYRTDSAALQECKWLSFHLGPIAALKPHSP